MAETYAGGRSPASRKSASERPLLGEHGRWGGRQRHRLPGRRSGHDLLAGDESPVPGPRPAGRVVGIALGYDDDGNNVGPQW